MRLIGSLAVAAWVAVLLGCPRMSEAQAANAAPSGSPAIVAPEAASPGASLDPLSLTDEQLRELAHQIRVELIKRYAAERDVLRWGRLLFPERFPLDFCHEMHGYFVAIRGEALTDTEAPRGHAKTTVKCFLIPTFQALVEPESFGHYLNIQATGPKALAINTAIRAEFETNELLREIYGDQMGPRWTDQQFVTAKGIVFTAIGAGQSIRGINYRNRRPDYIIVDDLYDEEDINNPEATEKKNAWFWGSLYPARALGRRVSFHLQGTAINRYDLLEQLKTLPNVKARTFQRVKPDGSVLWPALNTPEQVEAERQIMPPVIFAREYQNERRDDASSIVKQAWLAAWEYDPSDLRFDDVTKLVEVRLTIDPSIGTNNENDDAAYALVLKVQRADQKLPVYYVEGLRAKLMSLDERLDTADQMVAGQPQERRVNRVRVEAIAGFKDFAAMVKKRVPVHVEEIDHVKDKLTNLENKSHYFSNGRVRLNRNIDAATKKKLIYQMTTNHPKHDDLRDAVLLGLDDESASWPRIRA